MEWLEYLKLSGPATTGETLALMWFIGFIGGYIVGRIHAAFRHIDRYLNMDIPN